MIDNIKKTLIYDISNILFRCAAVQKNNKYNKDLNTDDLVGLSMHTALLSIYKWYSKFRPDFVVFAFEGGNLWRKQYTMQNGTRMPYKGNRVVDPEMKHYYEMLSSFKEVISQHTSICCLTVPTMEADDVIASYCQQYARDDHQIHIISGDRDFTQLLKIRNVHLVNPDTGKLRNQPGDKDYQQDLDYWLFLKCIRGDMGDYVPSAFPRVRETRIKKAWEDQFERANLMNEKWKDEKGVEHVVQHLYEHNVKLLSLFDQPEPHKTLLHESVKQQVNNIGTYSHFHFLRFLSKFELQRVAEEAIKFTDLFANNQRFMRGEIKKAEPPKEQAKNREAVPLSKTNLLQF